MLLLLGAHLLPADGNVLGALEFTDSGHIASASVIGRRDGGTWTSSSSQPSRLVFSTTADGSASPTERMRIDSAGNVGIGTSAPTSVLHIKSDVNNELNNGILFEAADSTHKVFRVLENSTGEAYSEWFNQNSLKVLIRLMETPTNGGNLGIGTTSPSAKLEVDGQAYFTDRILCGDASGTQAIKIPYSGTATAEIKVDGSAYFASNVGIGTTSPDALLTVSGVNNIHAHNASGDASIALSTGGTPASPTQRYTLFVDDSDGDKFIINDSTASQRRLVIDGSGNVGIGTTLPDSGSRLDVNGAINLPDDNAIAWGGGSNRPALIGNKANNTLSAYISGSERMRIDSAGRLLVGATSARSFAAPAQLLQIEAADGSGSGRICIGTNNNDNTAGPGIYMYRSRGGSLGSNVIVQDGDDIGSIYFQGADGTDVLTRAAQIRCEIDGTPGSNVMPGALLFSTTDTSGSGPHERMRIDSAGALTFSGNSSSSWALYAAWDTGSYSQVDAHFPASNRTLFFNSNTANNSYAVWNRNSGSSGKGFGLEGQNFKVVQGSTE